MKREIERNKIMKEFNIITYHMLYGENNLFENFDGLVFGKGAMLDYAIVKLSTFNHTKKEQEISMWRIKQEERKT
jgi:hypothetical protein